MIENNLASNRNRRKRTTKTERDRAGSMLVMPVAALPPSAPADRRELLLTIVVSLLFLAALAAGTVLLYTRSTAILRADLRDRLATQAALAAMQFSAPEIEAITGRADRNTALFRTLVDRAERIRLQIPDAAYLYVMRRTEDPDTLAFVIENDMLLPAAAVDRNGDGTLQPDEEISQPGDLFDIADVPALRQTAFEGPAADEAITRDQWGWWMSGYAPIRNTRNDAVAVLGIDMHADRFVAMTRRVFSPLALSLALLGLLFVGGGSAAMLRRRRLRLLQRIDAERRTLVTVASHKLGGPIATVRWWTEILREGTGGKPGERREAERQLDDASVRLSEVMQHLDEASTAGGSEKELWQRLAKETAVALAKGKRRGNGKSHAARHGSASVGR